MSTVSVSVSSNVPAVVATARGTVVLEARSACDPGGADTTDQVSAVTVVEQLVPLPAMVTTAASAIGALASRLAVVVASDVMTGARVAQSDVIGGWVVPDPEQPTMRVKAIEQARVRTGTAICESSLVRWPCRRRHLPARWRPDSLQLRARARR